MFWPYRPRQGHPSVPRWLAILALIMAVGLYAGFLSLLTQSPSYGPMP